MKYLDRPGAFVFGVAVGWILALWLNPPVPWR